MMFSDVCMIRVNFRSDMSKFVRCRASHSALVHPLEKSLKINVLCKLASYFDQGTFTKDISYDIEFHLDLLE